MFGQKEKGEITEATESSQGKVIVTIEVNKRSRSDKEVHVNIFDRGSEKTVLRANWFTGQSDMTSYHEAQALVTQFTDSNDYIVDHEHVKADLPYVRNVSKRTR